MSLWTKSPRFYGFTAVGLGLAGEAGLFALTSVALGSWKNWTDFTSPAGLQWVVLVWVAPVIVVASAVLIGRRMPRTAVGLCIVSALFYSYMCLAVSLFVSVLGLIDAPAMVATCLLGMAISRDRVAGPAWVDERGVQEVAGALLFGRFMGGTAFAVAGVLTLFAVYALSLGIATLNVLGVLYSLVYVMLCLPALPLFILGRRVWSSPRRPSG